MLIVTALKTPIRPFNGVNVECSSVTLFNHITQNHVRILAVALHSIIWTFLWFMCFKNTYFSLSRPKKRPVGLLGSRLYTHDTRSGVIQTQRMYEKWLKNKSCEWWGEKSVNATTWITLWVTLTTMFLEQGVHLHSAKVNITAPGLLLLVASTEKQMCF